MPNNCVSRPVPLCTVTAVAFAGVLYVILTGGTVNEALTGVVVDALTSGF